MTENTAVRTAGEVKPGDEWQSAFHEPLVVATVEPYPTSPVSVLHPGQQMVRITAHRRGDPNGHHSQFVFTADHVFSRPMIRRQEVPPT